MKSHNAGDSAHTKKFKAWKLVAYGSFKNKIKAESFEACLKIGSTRIFRKKILQGSKMHYVYLLQSEQYPEKTHIGYTENVQARVTAHNKGESIHTKEHRPWILVGYMCFKDKVSAMIFETFLKSGEGRTLTKKYFWNPVD